MQHPASSLARSMPADPLAPPDPAGRPGWSRRRVGALAASAAWLLLAGCGQRAPQAAPADSFYANFEGLQLQDQDGRALQWDQLAGRVVLVNFVFTGCSTVCPVQTRALVDFQQQLPAGLRPRVQQLSISLDPLSDSPAVLKAYAERMGVDARGWRFATGRPQDIERLSNALMLFRPGPEVRRPDDHSTALWLVDPGGTVRTRYGGNPPDVPRLLREITALDQLARSRPA